MGVAITGYPTFEPYVNREGGKPDRRYPLGRFNGIVSAIGDAGGGFQSASLVLPPRKCYLIENVEVESSTNAAMELSIVENYLTFYWKRYIANTVIFTLTAGNCALKTSEELPPWPIGHRLIRPLSYVTSYIMVTQVNSLGVGTFLAVTGYYYDEAAIVEGQAIPGQ